MRGMNTRYFFPPFFFAMVETIGGIEVAEFYGFLLYI